MNNNKTGKSTKKISIKKIQSKPKKNKGILFSVGNLFIILSLISFFIIFYPLLSTYLFPPDIKSSAQLQGDFITVPKIKAQAPLIFNVDPWKESEYQKVLRKGVAHAQNTPLPGESGRSFIFAHSSGNPFEVTAYNTVFLKLNELAIGDEIEIKRDEKIYKYSVTQKKVVWPNETDYLTETGPDGLVVQTCWPIGTSLKRLLIFAAPMP